MFPPLFSIVSPLYTNRVCMYLTTPHSQITRISHHLTYKWQRDPIYMSGRNYEADRISESKTFSTRRQLLLWRLPKRGPCYWFSLFDRGEGGEGKKSIVKIKTRPDLPPSSHHVRKCYVSQYNNQHCLLLDCISRHFRKRCKVKLVYILKSENFSKNSSKTNTFNSSPASWSKLLASGIVLIKYDKTFAEWVEKQKLLEMLRQTMVHNPYICAHAFYFCPSFLPLCSPLCLLSSDAMQCNECAVWFRSVQELLLGCIPFYFRWWLLQVLQMCVCAS